MISTAMLAAKACATAFPDARPARTQMTNVSIEMPMTVGTKTALTRSASRWIGARLP